MPFESRTAEPVGCYVAERNQKQVYSFARFETAIDGEKNSVKHKRFSVKVCQTQPQAKASFHTFHARA
jgi:hypothetical protein